MDFKNVRGTKDYWPEEQILREEIINTIKRKLELHGFNPAETPILNDFDVLASKYAGGSEILKETFKVERPKIEESDKESNREIGLRYDLTVPLAKLVGSNPTIKLPFKRYEVGKQFRDGPTRVGRLKEFLQFDADIVGSRSILSDAECIKIGVEVLKELKLKFKVEVNTRTLLNGILQDCNLDSKAILTIDKLEKIGESGVRKELEEKGFESSNIDSLFQYLTLEGSNDQVIKTLEGKCENNDFELGLNELRELLKALKSQGVDAEVKLNLGLARGLDIYTGTVFEFFLEDDEITSSIAAGGRYDNIIGAFIGSNESYPAVGVSFGVDVLFEALKKRKELRKTNTLALVIPIKTEDECLPIVEELRSAGIATEMDLMNRNISKNLDYANTQGIHFALVVGKKELSEGKVSLKDLVTGEQETLTVKDAVTKIKKERK